MDFQQGLEKLDQCIVKAGEHTQRIKRATSYKIKVYKECGESSSSPQRQFLFVPRVVNG